MFSLQEQVSNFYKFIGDIIKIHHSNPDVSDSELESIRTLEEQLFSTNEEHNVRIKEMTPLLNKILYRLYIEKGIKRKLIGSLIQLFYDKDNKNYDKNDSITQLCRHLVIDPKNLRIVSLGITKSVDLEEFKSNFKFPLISIENFPDGTMCVYTPELNNFQTEIESLDSIQKENSEQIDNESEESIQKPKLKRVKDFRCSTRKVLGTGYFNSPNKSFHDMFNENNEKDNLDLGSLPEKYSKNYTFVFNVQHPENRIITPVDKDEGCNILTCVYKYKNSDLVNEQWDLIVSSLGSDTFNTNIKNFANGMVESINLNEFSTDLAKEGFNFNIIENVTEEINKTINNYEELETYVNSKSYEFQGLVLKNSEGIRTKIRNSNYEKISELKGSLPIMIEEKNIPNLFKIYWRLRQKHDGSLTKFCHHFGKFEYNNLFNLFNQYVHKLTIDLHRTYLDAFAYKKMSTYDIPFHFKPFCGELHKIYNENRTPIILNIVSNFINNLPVSSIYWRIFNLEDNLNYTPKNEKKTNQETNIANNKSDNHTQNESSKSSKSNEPTEENINIVES